MVCQQPSGQGRLAWLTSHASPCALPRVGQARLNPALWPPVFACPSGRQLGALTQFVALHVCNFESFDHLDGRHSLVCWDAERGARQRAAGMLG